MFLLLSEGSRAHSFVALEECAEMALVPEPELVSYFLDGESSGIKERFCTLREGLLDAGTGSYAECLFDCVCHITRGEAKLVGVPIE